MDYSALEAQANAQGQAAAAQGQQMLASDQSNAANYQNQYNTAQGQTNTALGNLNSYNQANQQAYNPNTGTGTAGSMYQYNLGQANQEAGYDPAAMAAATQRLTQTEGQLGDIQNASNSGGFGGGAGYYASISNPLQQQVSNQNNVVGNYQQLLSSALSGAQANTAGGIQSQAQQIAGLNNAVQGYQAQANTYAQQMQAYETLAQQQGGLNAQQQQAYATIAQGYQSAQAAMITANAAMSQASTAASIAPSTIAAQQAQAKSTLQSILQGSSNGGTVTNGSGTQVYDPNYNAKLGADVQ